MRELALHILDIVENSLNAGATKIRIEIKELPRDNELRIVVEDNGRGLEEEEIRKALDPFYTTRSTRRVGLGLSLFNETCKRCEGNLEINSVPGRGSRVEAMLKLDHIDLPPLGDMASTIVTLIGGNPGIDFTYCHCVDSNEFELDTAELKKDLGEEGVSDPRTLKYLKEKIREALSSIGARLTWTFVPA